MTKTVMEWLHELPEGEQKEKALKNANYNLQEEVVSVHSALMAAFDWEDTPEGVNYWVDYYYKDLIKD